MSIDKKKNNKFSFEAVNITKSFNDVEIIKDFSISISGGEVVGLIGDNGVGKSTIMRIAALVDKSNSGEIYINGISALTDIKYYRTQIGYIPQSNALIEEMTALDNLKLFSLNNKNTTKNKIDELVEAFCMSEFADKKVKHLSGGMKRRVNIAAGLINSPKMIVADEPFAGLDTTQRQKVIDYLKEQSKLGVGQLITSHYAINLEPWSNSIIKL